MMYAVLTYDYDTTTKVNGIYPTLEEAFNSIHAYINKKETENWDEEEYPIGTIEPFNFGKVDFDIYNSHYAVMFNVKKQVKMLYDNETREYIK